MSQPESMAGQVLDIIASVPLTVATTGVVYGRSFPLPRNVSFGWSVQMSSPGTVKIKVELEQSNVRPATEGSADGNYVVPDNKAASPMFADITDKLVHNVAYTPNATAFARLKLTGSGSNDAATALALAQLYTVKNSF